MICALKVGVSEMNKIVQLLEKNMILAVLVTMLISIFLGVKHHSFFISLKAVLPIALFLMLYKPMTYLKLKEAFTKMTALKKKYLVTLTILYTIVFPISAYLLMKVMLWAIPNADPRMIAGVVLLALSPVASSAPAFTGMAGGKVQLTLIGVIYTFFLSFAVIPLGSKLILEHVVRVPVAELLKSLIIYVIIPLIIGQATKYVALHIGGEDGLKRLKEPLEILVLIGMFTMVFIVFGINATVILKNPAMIIVGVLIMNIYSFLRVLTAYAIGKALKLPTEHNIALTYSATNNMTTATAIGIATFGSLAAVGTVMGGPFAEMIQMILMVKVFDYIRSKEKTK